MESSSAGTSPIKLSVSLALHALQEASDEVRRLETALENARASRDLLLMDAATQVPIIRLARITGLSRERVGKIASNKTRRGV